MSKNNRKGVERNRGWQKGLSPTPEASADGVRPFRQPYTILFDGCFLEKNIHQKE
jgi:hypothetical protein